jgi:hypothetical protein
MNERPDPPLDIERLRRMKLRIIGEERGNLRTRAYSIDKMIEVIRRIIEQEADA